MKRITTIIIALALFSSCGKNTKETNSNEQKLSTNTETEKSKTIWEILKCTEIVFAIDCDEF